jgi:hypothetical protein
MDGRDDDHKGSSCSLGTPFGVFLNTRSYVPLMTRYVEYIGTFNHIVFQVMFKARREPERKFVASC